MWPKTKKYVKFFQKWAVLKHPPTEPPRIDSYFSFSTYGVRSPFPSLLTTDAPKKSTVNRNALWDSTEPVTPRLRHGALETTTHIETSERGANNVIDSK